VPPTNKCGPISLFLMITINNDNTITVITILYCHTSVIIPS